MTAESVNKEVLVGIAFVGNTLAPFWLEDPEKGNAQDFFNAFQSMNVEDVSGAWPFAESEEVLTEGLNLMVSGLDDGISQDLIWEYRRLFVGPAPKAAPPWGSVYTDWEMVVFGESTLKLRSWMKENGIARAGYVAEADLPEDHIGLMFACMSWIAQNKPDCLGEYLSLHFLTWAYHFLELVEQEAQHDFYRGLAMVSNQSLRGIQSELGLCVNYPHYFR